MVALAFGLAPVAQGARGQDIPAEDKDLQIEQISP
jgi:hypothetical protein